MCRGAYVCRDVGEGSPGQVQAGGDGGHSAAGEEPRDTKGEVARHLRKMAAVYAQDSGKDSTNR